MLNIVLPIAGRGSRFVTAGYTLPKPLIPVHGVPMIEVVVRNVRPSVPHRFVFIALQEHLDDLHMRETLSRIAPESAIIPVREVTQGAACTVLLSSDIIDSDDPLMIANSDQYVDIAIDDYLAELDRASADGLIMTMWADHPKWSFVERDASGRVCRVVEKEVVSNDATVGIYNFRHGRDFVRAARQMIARDLRVNGEFYVAPTYNQLIAEGAVIATYGVGIEGRGMHGLGIPSDLDAFLADETSRRATARPS